MSTIPFVFKKDRGSVSPKSMLISKDVCKVAYVDLDKRGYSVEATGNVTADIPMISLGIDGEDGSTIIEFPVFSGWDIVSASISKYTLTVCFKKMRK